MARPPPRTLTHWLRNLFDSAAGLPEGGDWATLRVMSRRLQGAIFMAVVGAGCVRALGCSTFGADDATATDGAVADEVVADGALPRDDAAASDVTSPPACADAGFTAEPTVTTCPEIVASGQATPLHVVTVGGKIYWTNFGGLSDDGQVMSARLDGLDAGSFATPTAASEKHPKFIRAAGGFIYWGTQDSIAPGADPEKETTGAVLARATSGGAILTYVGPPGATYTPRGIAVDATSVYWVTASGSIVSAPLGGGEGTVFRGKTGIVEINDLDLDGSGLVFAARGNGSVNPGVVEGVSFDAGNAAREPYISNRSSFPWSVRIASNSVLWTERGSDDAGTGTLNITSRLGNNVKALPTLKRPQFLAVDGTHVYVSVQGLGATDGEIRRMKLDGSDDTRLVSGLAMPHGIALDASYIYWTTPGDGRVWRMKKP